MPGGFYGLGTVGGGEDDGGSFELGMHEAEWGVAYGEPWYDLPVSLCGGDIALVLVGPCLVNGFNGDDACYPCVEACTNGRSGPEDVDDHDDGTLALEQGKEKGRVANFNLGHCTGFVSLFLPLFCRCV